MSEGLWRSPKSAQTSQPIYPSVILQRSHIRKEQLERASPRLSEVTLLYLNSTYLMIIPIGGYVTSLRLK